MRGCRKCLAIAASTSPVFLPHLLLGKLHPALTPGVGAKSAAGLLKQVVYKAFIFSFASRRLHRPRAGHPTLAPHPPTLDQAREQSAQASSIPLRVCSPARPKFMGLLRRSRGQAAQAPHQALVDLARRRCHGPVATPHAAHSINRNPHRTLNEPRAPFACAA